MEAFNYKVMKKKKVSGEFNIICQICKKNFKVNYFRKNKAKYCSMKCCRLSKIGNEPWNKNKKLHYKVWNKGKKGLQTAWNKGLKGYNKDYPRTKKWKDNISKSQLGKKIPKEIRQKISKTLAGKYCGSKNPSWIKDRSKIKSLQNRDNPEYRQWVKKVKKRDNNICRLKNKDCFGYNIVHHIKNWSQYPKLRYKVKNGITLCQAHHPRKRAEEKRLMPLFEELVSVSSE